MAKRQSFEFYPGAWLKNAELRVACMSSKGLRTDRLRAQLGDDWELRA